MRTGILGGAFNPPHFGHLLLAQEAYEQLDLDMVWFIPSWKPPHKEILLSFNHRLHLCYHATREDERFSVCPIEGRHRVRYTVETLRLLAATSAADAEFYLILGGDQAANFFTWREPEEIVKLASLVCIERTLFDRERIYDHWGASAHLLSFLDMPPLEISSTMVRQRVRDGRSIRYLVPDDVADVIKRDEFYVESLETTS